MAQYGRWVSLAVILTAILGVGAPTFGQTAQSNRVLEDVAPDDISISNAILLDRKVKCHDEECFALETIARTLEIFGDYGATTTQMGGWSPATQKAVDELTRPSTIRRRLRQTLLDHPAQFPAICRRMTAMIALYGGSDLQVGSQYPNVLRFFEMALLIDENTRPKSKLDCLRRAIAAFTPAMERLDGNTITDARYYCKDSPWRSKACNRIRRGG